MTADEIQTAQEILGVAYDAARDDDERVEAALLWCRLVPRPGDGKPVAFGSRSKIDDLHTILARGCVLPDRMPSGAPPTDWTADLLGAA